MQRDFALNVLRQLMLFSWQRDPFPTIETLAQIIANVKFLCPQVTADDLALAIKKGIEDSGVKIVEGPTAEDLLKVALGDKDGDNKQQDNKADAEHSG